MTDARSVDRLPIAVWIGGVAATVLVAATLTLQPKFLLYAGAVALGIVLVWSVVRAPHVAAAVLLVFVQLQAALKFYVSASFGPAKDALTLLLIVIAVAPVLLTRRGWLRVPDWPLLLAVLGVIVVYIIDPAGGHGAGWSPTVRLVVESLGLFLVGWLARDPARTWRWTWRALVGCGVAEALLGVAQQFIGVDRLVTVFGLAYGSQVRATSSGQLRSFGTFDDPFNYGAITTLALVVAAVCVQRLWLRWTILSVLTVGVIVSVDRTMLVLLPVLFLLWLIWAARRVLAGLLMATGVTLGGLVLSMPSPPPPPHVVLADTPPGNFLLTLNGRTQTWSQIVRGPQDLLFGRGVGVLGNGLARSQEEGVADQNRYIEGQAVPAATNNQLTSLDNSYLQVLADAGLLALALVVLFFARIRAILLARVPVRALSAPAAAGLGVLLVTVVDGLTRTSLTAFPFGFVALLTLGSAVAAADHARQEQSTPHQSATMTRPYPTTSDLTAS